MCDQNGCREVHHRLLHKDQTFLQSDQAKSHKIEESKKSEKDTTRKKDEPLQAEPFTEGEQKLIEQRVKQPDMTTMMTETTGNVALRTIPVYIKNGNRKLQVNALLDDASTKTYINVDAAAELGLQGCLQKVNVSVLNGKIETF